MFGLGRMKLERQAEGGILFVCVFRVYLLGFRV